MKLILGWLLIIGAGVAVATAPPSRPKWNEDRMVQEQEYEAMVRSLLMARYDQDRRVWPDAAAIALALCNDGRNITEVKYCYDVRRENLAGVELR